MRRADVVAAVARRARLLLLAEDVPERRGFLQAVGPAATLAGLLALVALAATRRTPAGVAGFLCLAAGLAAASRVPARAFAARTGVPAGFALVVAAPRAVLAGGPRLVGPLSASGVEYALVLAGRVGACAGLAALLLLTTPFPDLLAGLRRLRAPPLARSLLATTHRYLLLVLGDAERTVRVRRARTPDAPGLRRDWRDAGALVGQFLARSVARGERVGRAARARGGPGPPPARPPAPPGLADAAFGLVVVAVALAVLS